MGAITGGQLARIEGKTVTPIAGNSAATVTGISDSGILIGQRNDHAIRVDGTTVTTLDGVGGINESATAINRAGTTIVGASYMASGEQISWVVEGGTTTPLPALDVEYSNAYAHIEDAFLFDHLADAGAPHVHERRGRLHRHRLLEIADGQDRVDSRCAAHLQHDARLDVSAESLQRHLQPVRAGRQIRHGVDAAAVGNDGPAEAGVDLRGDDGDARQHGAALVADSATELRGRLCPG